MPIALLRLIDFWVGVPLCFVLTYMRRGYRWVTRLIIRPRPVKKILVIKLAELGAIVLAYPFFKELGKNYPDAEIYALTFKKNEGVFTLLDNAVSFERIITVDDSSWVSMVKGLAKVAVFIWREKFDIVIDLEFFSRIGALLTFASGAPVTAGFYPYGFEGLYRGDFLTHKVAYNPIKHVSVNFMSVAFALRQAGKSSPESADQIDERSLIFPTYQSKEQARESLKRLGLPLDKKLFLMNAGEGVLPLREWPLENFIEVARFILKDPNHALVLVGTESANRKADDLAAALNDPRVINCSGKTNLFQLMELFLVARAVIANDCGLMHMAMLTPVKKVVFFGPETPQVFGPLGTNTHVFYSQWPCSPCLSVYNHRNSACRDNRCLKAIAPQHVINVIKDN